MKKVVVFFTLLLVVLPSCKKKERFTEPEIILKKWAAATERFDYNEYRKCEAYPKTREVFREIYDEYYITDTVVKKVEPLSEKDVQEDPDGNSYVKRNVIFECLQVRRKDGKAMHAIGGEVYFIRFVDGERKKEGWLMANRTLTHLPIP